MRRAWRGAMPLLLTLPLGLERRPRARRRRLRRLAFGALIAFGVALIAVGLWLPANGSAEPSANASTVRGDAQLRSLAIGDRFKLERPHGATSTYEVAALDVVDAERVQLERDADESTVVLVTCWPVDTIDVAGNWRYVVTARRVGLASAAEARAASF